MSTYYRCAYCDEVYEEGTEIHRHVSGRTGGYENWLPDEDYYDCPSCGKSTEDANEVEIEELLEEIEELKARLKEKS